MPSVSTPRAFVRLGLARRVRACYMPCGRCTRVYVLRVLAVSCVWGAIMVLAFGIMVGIGRLVRLSLRAPRRRRG